MGCPTCGCTAPHHQPRQADSEPISLICQLCDRPFKARQVKAVCPACARVAATTNIGGEASGA